MLWWARRKGNIKNVKEVCSHLRSEVRKLILCLSFQKRQYVIIDTEGDDGEKATAVVPKKWIFEGNKALCPPNIKDKERASKNYWDEDLDSWKMYRCTVRKTFGKVSFCFFGYSYLFPIYF